MSQTPHALPAVLEAQMQLDQAAFLYQQAQHDDAIAAWAEVARRFGKHEDPCVRVQVFRALVAGRTVLRELGRHDQADAVDAELGQHLLQHTEPSYCEDLARALREDGHPLRQGFDPLLPLAVFDEVIERLSKATEPAERTLLADALLYKAEALSALDQPEQALAVCDELIAQLGTDPQPGPRAYLFACLRNRASALWDLGRVDDTLAALHDVGRLFGTELAWHAAVTDALQDRLRLLRRLERPEEARAAAAELVQRFTALDSHEAREHVLLALLRDAGELGLAGQHADALAIWDELAERHGCDGDALMRDWVGLAHLMRSEALRSLGRLDDAIAALDVLIAREVHTDHPRLRSRRLRAMSNKVALLAMAGQLEAALATCAELEQQTGDDQELEDLECLVGAQLSACAVLSALERPEDQMALCDTIAARCLGRESLWFVEVHATVLLSKGHVLKARGDLDQAARVWQELLERFGGAPQASVQELAARARQALAELQG